MTPSRRARLLWGFARHHAARGLAVSLAVLLLTAVCTEVKAERPVAVDHSTEMYFPPIGGPQGAGDCTCWSSVYYYNTYMQARDEGLDASSGDEDLICSSRFLFALIAQGSWGAECTRHAMERLCDVGSSSLTLHPYGEPWNWDDMTRWPTEAAWIQALNNRTGTFHSIRADNDAGLEAIKQHIADGGMVVTRGDFLSNYGDYGASASGPGISFRVMYRRDGYHFLRHSVCIVGYDDNKVYWDDRYGEIRYGAFLIANSEGPDWGSYNSTGTGSKGFIWLAYTMFREQEFGWYDYDLDTSPCFDNAPYPEVYYNEDRPNYRPQLYAVAGINHEARNRLTFTGGVGPTAAPEFMGPEAIEETEFGDIPIDDTKRVAVDLTDGVGLIPPGTTKNVFIALTVSSLATTPATITSVDFYCDFDGDEVYMNIPGQMGPVLMIWPGTTGYVSASVANPGQSDLDGDGDGDLSDLEILAGCLSGPGAGCPVECEAADLNEDLDVDMGDFALFQPGFTGSLP